MRRLVYFQGRPVQGLKILYLALDGSFYISGDRVTPTLVTGPSGGGFTSLAPLGILATGPGSDDWIVGGFGVGSGGGRSLIFWGPSGIVETVALAVPNTQILSAGNFLSTVNATLDAGLWATPDDNGSGTGDFNNLGYVLPDVAAEGTNAIGVELGFRATDITVDRDLGYALVAEFEGAATLYFAGGGSVSSAFPPALIGQTTLIWPYAYVAETDYIVGEELPAQGRTSITLDVWELTEGGGAELLETRTITFYSPGTDAAVLDISYHPPAP